MSKIVITFVALVFLFVFVPKASAVSLNSIGSVDTTQVMYNEWWYTAENPLLQGSSADGQVTITIDGTGNSAPVSGGAWAYRPTTLTTGDHDVIITDSGGSLTFKLHIGSGVPGDTTDEGGDTSDPTEPATLPVAGSAMTTLVLLTAGLATVGLGFHLKRTN